jgi:hypothetical protein
MANDVAETGDEIDKMSQKIGISAESYQEWGYVFERCGTDVNNLQAGMKTLSGVIADAGNGSSSAAEKLAAVGLSIDDLNGKSQDEQLSIVIAALQDMEAGAERTSAATDLLGRSATDMAAVLNMTAEETEALKQEANDYGMVMSNEAVAASAAFEDSLTKLTGTMSGLKNRMVGELLPGIRRSWMACPTLWPETKKPVKRFKPCDQRHRNHQQHDPAGGTAYFHYCRCCIGKRTFHHICSCYGHY